MKSFLAVILLVANFSLDDIILDIYNTLSEFGDTDYEQLQTDLYALHESPIDLNHTNEEELNQLFFLNPQQIDALLLYADTHPFESLYELRLIPCLQDYEIRNLLPFVRIEKPTQDAGDRLYAREVFAKANHEIIARVDARNIEDYAGTDPMYVQTRYRFDYRRRVIFGARLQRPAGGDASTLQYGGYLQLRDIGHLHSFVAGNFQASFGQGLVLAPAFHPGKNAYAQSAGVNTQGLRYYSSVDGNGLHGAGATLRWAWNKQTRLDVSALYSLQRANDSTWHHVVGANVTVRHRGLEVQLTAVENIWSDSIHPYRNTGYNTHYFRGNKQAVLGASVRYRYHWFDAFGEVATAENYQRFEDTISSGAVNSSRWGFGILAGSRFYPTDGVVLTAIYRYYSPYFDNALGYGFSESSRIGDEHGGYLRWDITRWKNWQVIGYADVFSFSGPKYGIPDSGTIGYDLMAEAKYSAFKSQYSALSTSLRLRTRKKGSDYIYAGRAQFDWSNGGWSLRTTADFNYVQSYGISLAQDVAYDFQRSTFNVPLSLRLRAQGFDAREWDNRIYLYEHDVLYAFSIPATYGLGGRAYLCLRWQIIPQLALYFRASETIYASSSASAHKRPNTRTDLHQLLRAKL